MRTQILRVVYSGLLGLMATAVVTACPPHPDLSEQIASGTKAAPYYLENLEEMRAKGVSTGLTLREGRDGSVKLTAGESPSAIGTFKALAVLVEFSDNASAVAPAYFDSLLFDSVGNSVRDYYSEISYDQLDIVTVNLPSALGWQTAPQTYAYYVNGQNGTGAYPQNSQRLTENVVDQIDALVNFSEYDNDGDGFVDVMILIHAGSGAEMTGSNDDIWSHKWAITPRLRDGVYISDYTVQPELWVVPGDMTIGVYAHELGHAFGLPDLYDTDVSASRGIGIWGIMCYGSWLGAGGMGGSPSHPCAWSRIQMGFASATNVLSNTTGTLIGAVEGGGPIYRLWTSGAPGNEYFLVENRQKTGYDSYLYSSGLLIWHIDEGKATINNLDNAQEWWPGLDASQHYRVALEQSDGLWEIEKKFDYGDAGDPFPGSLTRRTFDALSTPNSNSYLGGASFVKVDNISNSGAVMTADLTVGLAASIEPDDPPVPTSVTLGQNYPNPFNPSTTISFELSAAMAVRLDVFDILGRRVRTLLDGPAASGETQLTWDGRDDDGAALASGIYFYRLKTEAAGSTVKKMTLVK